MRVRLGERHVTAQSQQGPASCHKEAEMATTNGGFVWYELMTPDLPGARTFYDQGVDWHAVDSQMSGMDYWMFNAGETSVAGLMTLPEDARKMGTPPNWIGYVGVADVDATAAQATANGGKVYVPPTDIPNVGRFSVIADPQGAALGLFKPSNAEQESPARMDQQGHIGWHELHAGEYASAFDFYSKLFGWQKKDSMDMGEMGIYQMFGTADTTLGGMMTKAPMEPVPHWNYYLNVGPIDPA